MTESAPLRSTPLEAEHIALGGKMVPFAGWSMPVQYPAGIQAEHRAVRTAAGLFDVSHMGEFHVRGPDALRLILRVAVNNAAILEIGQAQYSALCTPRGTLIDDLLVYRLGEDAFLLVVNASNRERDWAWIESVAEGMDLELEDRSDQTALLALQGPRAQEILAPLTRGVGGEPLDLESIRYYRFAEGEVCGVPTWIARTGYTGEDGFELYLPWEQATPVWRALLKAGEPLGLLPAGLGARDSLRLEVGYPLYGNDLDEEHTALESGLGWIVKLGREEGFIGEEALASQKAVGVERRLVGIAFPGRAFPRPGYPLVADGRVVGVVTSGTLSPSVGTGIALGYVPVSLATPGSTVSVRIRDKDIPGTVTRPPFYAEGSIRR
jgi:aminomethyltransferase